jgi:hypothetical protein
MAGSTRIEGHPARCFIRAAEAEPPVVVHTCCMAVLWSAGSSSAAVLGAFITGAVLCLMKGDGGGLAMAVGNLSAPYIIIAVAAGLTSRRWWLGALLGVIATEATVAGFYETWASYFGHEVSEQSVTVWGGAGIVSGALFGAIGWAARARPGLRYVLPLLLLIEPFATQGSRFITTRIGIGSFGIDSGTVPAYSIEVVAGVIVFLMVRRHLRSRRARGIATSPG